LHKTKKLPDPWRIDPQTEQVGVPLQKQSNGTFSVLHQLCPQDVVIKKGLALLCTQQDSLNVGETPFFVSPFVFSNTPPPCLPHGQVADKKFKTNTSMADRSFVSRMTHDAFIFKLLIGFNKSIIL
jgi:hypothetical protein